MPTHQIAGVDAGSKSQLIEMTHLVLGGWYGPNGFATKEQRSQNNEEQRKSSHGLNPD